MLKKMVRNVEPCACSKDKVRCIIPYLAPTHLIQTKVIRRSTTYKHQALTWRRNDKSTSLNSLWSCQRKDSIDLAR